MKCSEKFLGTTVVATPSSGTALVGLNLQILNAMPKPATNLLCETLQHPFMQYFSPKMIAH
jgi:hypothetical protein